MKNIHVIQTDKPSRLAILGMSNNLQLFDKPITFKTFGRSPQNIYITNSEEIKEGDWVYSKEGNLHNNFGWNYGDSKIILTTDQSLDGVQPIDDEFLEWFVKNPSCEEVEVVKEDWMITADLEFIYKIIIPKEETLPQFGTKEFNDLANQYFGGKQEKNYNEEDMEIIEISSIEANYIPHYQTKEGQLLATKFNVKQFKKK